MKRHELRMPVLRQKLLDPQLSNSVSPMRSQETDLQTQWLTLHQENARLDDLMNQIRSANESMYFQNLGFAVQSQTSKFELSRAQTDVSHLRGRVERIPNLETQKIFIISGKKIIPLLVIL